jgi:hypothetical protein
MLLQSMPKWAPSQIQLPLSGLQIPWPLQKLLPSGFAAGQVATQPAPQKPGSQLVLKSMHATFVLLHAAPQ